MFYFQAGFSACGLKWTIEKTVISPEMALETAICDGVLEI